MTGRHITGPSSQSATRAVTRLQRTGKRWRQSRERLQSNPRRCERRLGVGCHADSCHLNSRRSEGASAYYTGRHGHGQTETRPLQRAKAAARPCERVQSRLVDASALGIGAPRALQGRAVALAALLSIVWSFVRDAVAPVWNQIRRSASLRRSANESITCAWKHHLYHGL